MIHDTASWAMLVALALFLVFVVLKLRISLSHREARSGDVDDESGPARLRVVVRTRDVPRMREFYGTRLGCAALEGAKQAEDGSFSYDFFGHDWVVLPADPVHPPTRGVYGATLTETDFRRVERQLAHIDASPQDQNEPVSTRGTGSNERSQRLVRVQDPSGNTLEFRTLEFPTKGAR